MKRELFDASHSFYALSDVLKNANSNREVKKLLESFECIKNKDLTDFLHNKCITFEKNYRAKTYLYFDNSTKQVVAYFSISITTLHTDGIDKQVIELLDGHTADRATMPCYLIGQLGKSDAIKEKIGSFLLDDACQIINECQNKIGGRFILLDSVNNIDVIKFYEDNQFMKIENDGASESIKMIRPYFDLST